MYDGNWKTVYNRHRRWSGDGTWVGILDELRRDAEVRILPTVRCDVDPRDVVGVRVFDLAATPAREPNLMYSRSARHRHDGSITGVGFAVDGAVDLSRLTLRHRIRRPVRRVLSRGLKRPTRAFA